MRSILLALALLAAPAAVQAQAAAPPETCVAKDADLPSELGAWRDKAPLTAASGVSGLDKAVLAPGKAYAATLSPAADVTYPIKPDRPAIPDAKGGLLAFDAPVAGTYAVALGAGAWVDVIKDGVALRSTAHGHGPACSTVRKIVNFDLRPGRYVIQIASSAETTLPILVTVKP